MRTIILELAVLGGSVVARLLRDPLFLLCLAASLAAFVIQSGELGSSDTMHRLQTAHSFWTSEPPVFPEEYPEFGVHGRRGKLYDWYGIGQPLLMLPPDIVGTFLERLPLFEDYNGNDPSVRAIVVSYSTNILLSVLTTLVCFHFLRRLRFSTRQSVAGVLGLLFCTTHLHYTQNMMENNYVVLLTLAGFSCQYEWLRTAKKRALLIGSVALGLNLLTRLTAGMDLLAGGVFLFLVLWFEHLRAQALWQRFLTYVKTALPVYSVFLLIDRWYQYYRFGSFFTTYSQVVAQERRHLYPWLSPNYPFETPLRVGFCGPLITPEKSVFLFDPLLLMLIAVTFLAWKRFRPEIRAYVISALLLLLAYICFYAKYTVWSGDSAWGDRYVSSAVELAAFISVPLWLRHQADIGKVMRLAGVVLIVVSTLIQLAALAFWLPLEIYQMETLGHPTFVIALRFKNIVAFALGKMAQWRLCNHAMTQDAWDYVHITTWNFLPFVLRRVGEAPEWVVNAVFAVWSVGAFALAWVLWWLRRMLPSGGLYAHIGKMNHGADGWEASVRVPYPADSAEGRSLDELPKRRKRA
ncbi:MAG TPA: hypothetical protein VEV41_03100 [Terriglobales bacterium]|nr:hypothetical protein [Terriglobales bacterium]